MNYQKHYNLLMERGKTRELDGYTENHHIVPKCMGGSNDSDNLVVLTPEEHYVAHQLLVKMYPEHDGLIVAAIVMSWNLNNKRQNNKLYGWLRRKCSKTHSGENHPMYGKKHSEETRKKMSESALNRSEETRKKMSESAKKRKASDETKKKISKGNKGNICSLETRKKISKALKGKKHSDETKKKLSELGKGNTSHLGHKHTKETKRKISDAIKAQRAKIKVQEIKTC